MKKKEGKEKCDTRHNKLIDGKTVARLEIYIRKIAFQFWTAKGMGARMNIELSKQKLCGNTYLH